MPISDRNNHSFIDTIFETASTISNKGLSMGITIMDSDSISKIILYFNMIMGGLRSCTLAFQIDKIIILFIYL